jgi:uncharacterized membrane protein YphA (DoxX/SURF4 family)
MTDTATIIAQKRSFSVAPILRMALGLVFLASGTQKILQPHEFLSAVAAYEILSPSLTLIAAVVLPSIELALGILLVAGAFVPGALLLASLSLVAFSVALSVALIRKLTIDCGCFSLGTKATPLNIWSLVRTLALCAVSIGLYIHTMGWLHRRKP